MHLNGNDYNNAEQILKKVLNSEIGRRAIKNLNNSSEREIIDKIAGMDKNEIAAKLNSLGISQFSDRINSISQADLIKVLSENPNLLKNLLK